MRNYRKYTNEDIIQYAKEVVSARALCLKLGLKPIGGNYATIKKKLAQLKIDITHWRGQLWSKGDRLKQWEDYIKPTQVKKHIISQRGVKCEQCGLESWLNLPIKLELHHIKDKSNHPDNLQLLCPNCHAYTENYRNYKQIA